MNWRTLLAAGLVAAALGGLAGGVAEWRRFGATPDAAAGRVEAQVRGDFDRMIAALSDVASGVASDPEAARALGGLSQQARELFDLVERRVQAVGDLSDRIAVTIYDASGSARAWTGRPSDIRVKGSAAFFVTPSPLGLQLVHVVAIVAADHRRLGTVAAEHVLSPAQAAARITASDWVLQTPLGPVSLRMRYEGAGDRPRPNTFLLRAPDGGPLVEVMVPPDGLAAARAHWRRGVVSAVVAICGLTIFLLIGPVLDRRAGARRPRDIMWLTVAAVAMVLVGTSAIWFALVLKTERVPAFPATLLLGSITVALLIALVAGPAARAPVAWRSRRGSPATSPLTFGILNLTAGGVVAGMLLASYALLARAVLPATLDVRYFSLHLLSAERLALLGGILTSHVAAVWLCTLALSLALSVWRVRAVRPRGALAFAVAWLLPAAILAWLAHTRSWAVPGTGLLLTAVACAAAAFASRRSVVWYRHASVAGRILGLFVAFLAPALLLYPSLDFFAERATRQLIVTRYAVEAQHHPQALLERITEARREIDSLTVLPDLVSAEPVTTLAAPRTESAYLIWRQTALARARLTSAIELYDRAGALVSRFALNFPEYTAAGPGQAPPSAASCDWDVFGEAAPFGSGERRMLHADRRICTAAGPDGTREALGSIVIHVVLDYRTLPFITSQSPYFEVFRPAEGGAAGEGTPGSDVDVAIYGWGLRPIYTSGGQAWPLSERLFSRIYASRDPFWATIDRGNARFHVYVSNDRAAIYATGYPALTLFDHLVHLAELSTLSGVVFVVVLFATAIFTRLARERSRLGRALLREIRASFYRKLFLAFVLASMVPVLTLALVIRAYVATQLRGDIEAEAARTAAVAQRVIEESDTLQRRGAEGLTPVTDDVLVWISQVIDQDVNIFDEAQLVATSERDLFASGLLPTRAPDDVYRAIVLDRLPSFVGEDRIGTFPYMIAAAPVRAAGRDAILTVPLADRQREIEREIDDLDRGVHLASLFFVLLGAAIGVSMAERIADPVRRLTRATRRIASGDFDAHIAVRSADELKRLVDAFNKMAAELKAQRAQLERTHRIEAWAEMARQVAHEIKNPLTPIQLSAEHLRRVHEDRGEPMGPVLESCVDSILVQVRLLRQIAAEFSSFASAPVAKRAPVDLADLITEIIEPYRAGLTGRVTIENHVAPPLPRVLVDRNLVARALTNLVENALHAMPGGGTLALRAAAVQKGVTLEVRDTGVGMDEEALDRMFEPYFSTKTTGTGLGLPIARRNIELNEGSIGVESVRGRGTTVRVTLPAA